MSLQGYDLCQIPSGTPPSGEESNFVNPANLAQPTWGIGISVTATALLFVITRVYVNFRKLQPSDYFVVVAMALDITYVALCIALRHWSRHIWDVPVCMISGEYMQLLFSQAMVYAVTTFFAKSSILLLYLQLFAVARKMRIAIWAGLLFTGVLYWAAFPIEVPFMTPSQGQTWQELALSGRANRIGVWGLVQGPLSVVLDIYIFVLPFPVLMKLHLSRKRRLELLFVFATAFLAVVASIVGLVYRVKLVYDNDITWANGSVFFCTIFENNIAIMVSCMPASAVFAKTHIAQTSFIKSLRSTLFSSNNKSGGKSTPPGPSMDGCGKGAVMFGQGNDMVQGRTERGQRNYFEPTEVMQSRDNIGLVRPGEDVYWTTAVTSAPVAPSLTYVESDGSDGIIQTTEFMQQYHSTKGNQAF